MKLEEENAVRFDPPIMPRYVYFIIYRQHVVYVGQTSNIHGRISSHKDRIVRFKKANIDSVYYIVTTKNEANALEKKMILKYRPKFNSAGLKTAWNNKSNLRPDLKDAFKKVAEVL
jgi:predicted GIY-YIG superfamily endonuclease